MGRRADGHRDRETFLASAPRPHTRGSKVRARPASARPSGKGPSTNDYAGASRRREYWPRHLPPPLDDCSSNGDCSSRSGGAGRGNGDYHDGHYRDRGLRPASSGKCARVPAAAAATVDARARKGGREKWWDRYCAVGMGGMDVAARRALAARAAAAVSAAGEAAGMKPQMPTEKAFIAGGGGGAGRPYMSRADRAAEDSKEVAHLRGEADFWRAEAGAARQEAAETCKRLETQEQHIAGVLQKTAEVLPGYCYGMDFGGVSDPKALVADQQLSVLEHRRELEKVLVIRRLKGQVSRLLERVSTAEEELLHVKRSCQFTALTEMLSTGEEYVKEVERLRAIIDKRRESTDLLSGTKHDLRPRVVAIPSAVSIPAATLKPPNAGETARDIDNASALESADQPDRPLSFDGGRSGPSSPVAESKLDQQNHPQQHSRGGEPDQQLPRYPTSPLRPRNYGRGYSPPRGVTLSKDAQRALDRESPARCGGETDGVNTQHASGNHTLSSHQQGALAAAAHSVTRHRGSGTHGGDVGRDRRRREGTRRGEGFVRSRARAGLLGVPAPVGNQGYINIDAPMRGGAAAARGGSGVTGRQQDDGDGEGVDRGGTVAKGRRVPMTSEMEMDVMKGLVLAQHQRIERQRGRMQELERDLRDYRRATVGGGEWPQASPSFSTSLRPGSPSSRGGLMPSRSAPAGLHNVVEERTPAPATTTAAQTHTLRNTSGGSRAPTAAQRRAEAARLLEETAWLKLKEASRAGGWEEGGGDAQTDVSLTMDRPRSAAATAAAAVGSVLTKVWCGRDLGGGVETKPRPKSASSRFATSPGRRRARRAGSAGAKRGVGAGEKGSGCGEDAYPLPEGWAEAVDKDTGHVYYYSDKRSMWVKPTAPASPRTPITVEDGEGDANTDEATGVAATLVAAATELACPRLAASTLKEADGEDYEEDGWGGEADEERGEGNKRRSVAHDTASTPLAVTRGIIDGAIRDSTASQSGAGEKDGSRPRRGEKRHVQYQVPLENASRGGGLGHAEAGGGGPQRLGNVRSGADAERPLAKQKPSELEGSRGGGNTPATKRLGGRKREPSDQGARTEVSLHPAGVDQGGSWNSVGDGDTSTPPRVGSLARHGPCLPHKHTALSSTSTSNSARERSVSHTEIESAQGLAHTVAAHAIERALSQPPDSDPQNSKHSMPSSSQRANESADSARGRRKERSPDRQHHGGADNGNERDEIVDLSVDSDDAPPLPPERVARPGALASAPVPSAATVHANAAVEDRVGGNADLKKSVVAFPDGGEHPLSLEETENAMAALIATLRPESTTPSFGEPPANIDTAVCAPVDGDQPSRSIRVPAERSPSSSPLNPEDSDTDGDFRSPRLRTRNRLQPVRANPTEAFSPRAETTDPCPSPRATPPSHIDRYNDAQCRIEDTQVRSAVDEGPHHRLPEVGNAANREGVGYGDGKGVDTEASRGFGGGTPGGGESGEGGASEAATGVYEDDFDDD